MNTSFGNNAPDLKLKHTLRIAYFYPELLNLYGDNGNIEILVSRAKHYGFDASVVNVSINTNTPMADLQSTNFVFMGGGPDASQKIMYEDLKNNKAAFLKDYIESEKCGLFICGAYQLLGNYYKASDGFILDGLGVFDLHTEHFGSSKPRCIGNTMATLSDEISKDPVFPSTPFNAALVGFENHGGRTYLSDRLKPFAYVVKGHGNNSEDLGEGLLYKNSIGTYFHGPLLSKNPHLADYLIFKALGISVEEILHLPKIDDSIVFSAHTASKNLKQ